MIPWSHRIDVRPEWADAQSDEEGWREVAISAAAQMRNLPDSGRPPDIIIAELEDVADDDGSDVDDFDCVWEDLYDWADVDKRLWIATA